MSPWPPSWYRALSAAGCGRGDSSAGGSRARGRSETPLSHIQAADLAVDFRLENIFDSDEGMARLLGAGLVHVDVNHESLCLMRLPYMSCLYVCLMRLPYMSGRRSDSY